MQIQPIGVQTNYKASFSPNFKSCYPVTHWLAEANESYAPVLTTELAKKLQGILVRYLNASAKKYSGKKAAFCQEVKDFMASTDRDYANLPFVRSFYDKKGGFFVFNFQKHGQTYILLIYHEYRNPEIKSGCGGSRETQETCDCVFQWDKL